MAKVNNKTVKMLLSVESFYVRKESKPPSGV